MTKTSQALLRAAAALRDDVERLSFKKPVAFVYDPLVYAWPAHAQYIEKYGDGEKEIVLVGMNPGPFGMAQTGVPFGEVRLVSTWLKIDAPIGAPARMHEKRPVLGYACPRSEVSGARLWGAIAKKHPDPRTFFRRCFVVNFCPLLFLDDGGRNLTPDKLAAAQRAPLEAACRAHLTKVLAALRPSIVLGVGGYAAKQARACVSDDAVTCGTLPHPSPASPAANLGWDKLARTALQKLHITPFL